LKRLITLLVASIIIAITVIMVAAIFGHLYRFPNIYYNLLGARFALTHWFAWGGTLFVFISSIAQPIVKRKSPSHYKTMLPIHMLGNLIAVMFISIHFAQQLTRPSTSFPDLGTGVVLYASMILLVATGLARYSGIIRKYFRSVYFLHAAFALTFFVVIIVHVLHGISII
jgi:hypothetical protein